MTTAAEEVTPLNERVECAGHLRGVIWRSVPDRGRLPDPSTDELSLGVGPDV